MEGDGVEGWRGWGVGGLKRSTDLGYERRLGKDVKLKNMAILYAILYVVIVGWSTPRDGVGEVGESKI